MAANLKGRSLAGGVAMSWFAHVIQIASGFIIPRLIDQDLGKEVLGVWDFCWSLIGYFGFVEAGLNAGVNRAVALHLATGDVSGLNRVVSSINILQRCAGAGILLLVTAAAFLLSSLLKNKLGNHADEAQMVVILLGASVAVSVAGSAYQGVVTGCQLWKQHHLIYAITNTMSACGMLVALELKLGITALAGVHLTSEILGRIARTKLAYDACPNLAISLKQFDLETVKELLHYNSKIVAARLTSVITHQSINVMIVGFLGPAALAVFSRPRALIKHASTFSQKYSMMLAPTISAMSIQNSREEIAGYLTASTRTGLLIGLPMMMFLLVFGAPIIGIWMGDDYSSGLLTTTMVIGATVETACHPIWSCLAGLNLHGRLALVSALGSISTLSLTYCALAVLGLELQAVAVLISIFAVAVNGIYVPLYACRSLGMQPGKFFKECWILPLKCALPFVITLACARSAFYGSGAMALAAGVAGGGSVLAVCYWLWVLTPDLKNKLSKSARKACGLKL